MFGGISLLLIIDTLQSSHMPSGLSVSFTPHILQIIYHQSRFLTYLGLNLDSIKSTSLMNLSDLSTISFFKSFCFLKLGLETINR